MIRSARGLRGYSLHAVDGDIGHVDDLFFDDEQWTVRYLVVNTGTWLLGRRVLVSPVSFERVDWEHLQVVTRLTREQVQHSPEIDTERPVSREDETGLYGYYGWPMYWGGAGLWGTGMYPAALLEPPLLGETSDDWRAHGEDPDRNATRVRSARDVTGYAFRARDGDLGHVDDLLVDDETWEVRYLAVDTGTWLPGKKVLLAPQWVERIDWTQKVLEANLERELVASAPEWDPARPVEREYERRLFEHYSQREHRADRERQRRAA